VRDLDVHRQAVGQSGWAEAAAEGDANPIPKRAENEEAEMLDDC